MGNIDNNLETKESNVNRETNEKLEKMEDTGDVVFGKTQDIVDETIKQQEGEKKVHEVDMKLKTMGKERLEQYVHELSGISKVKGLKLFWSNLNFTDDNFNVLRRRYYQNDKNKDYTNILDTTRDKQVHDNPGEAKYILLKGFRDGIKLLSQKEPEKTYKDFSFKENLWHEGAFKIVDKQSYEQFKNDFHTQIDPKERKDYKWIVKTRITRSEYFKGEFKQFPGENNYIKQTNAIAYFMKDFFSDNNTNNA